MRKNSDWIEHLLNLPHPKICQLEKVLIYLATELENAEVNLGKCLVNFQLIFFSDI